MATVDVQVAHIWRRLGFGGTRADIDAGVAMGPQALIASLLARPVIQSSAAVPNPWVWPAGTDYIAAGLAMSRQLELMAYGANTSGTAAAAASYNPLQERIAWILQGLVVTGISDFVQYPDELDHINTLRNSTAGSYKQLLTTITTRPGMVKYLNLFTSTAAHPNENYARELMELFALGRVNPYDGSANYTQGDVHELARALTGWQYNYTTGAVAFNASLWDSGQKVFRGASLGAAKLAEVMNAITAHPAWPYFVPARFYKELTGLTATKSVLDALAPAWGPTGNITALVTAITARPEFLSDQAIHAKVKCPVELLVSSARLLGWTPGGRDIGYEMTLLNQHPFVPPNVSGWLKGDQWLNATNLLRWSTLANTMAMKGFNWAGSQISPINPAPTAVFNNATAATAAGYVLHLAGLDNASATTTAKLADYAASGPWSVWRAAGLLNLLIVSPEWLCC